MWKTAAMPDRMGSPDKLTIVTSSKGSSFAKDSNVNFRICKGETVTEQRWTSREVTNKLAIYCNERRNQEEEPPSPLPVILRAELSVAVWEAVTIWRVTGQAEIKIL